MLADEGHVCLLRARLQEKRIGVEEAGTCLAGELGHAVEGGTGVGEAGKQRRAHHPDTKTGLAQTANSGKADVRPWGAGLEQAGELRRPAS